MSQISKICNCLLIDDVKRFCGEMLHKIGSDETFPDTAYFSDEAKLHLDVIVKGVTAEFRAANHLKKLPNIKGTHQRLQSCICDDVLRDRISFWCVSRHSHQNLPGDKKIKFRASELWGHFLCTVNIFPHNFFHTILRHSISRAHFILLSTISAVET